MLGRLLSVLAAGALVVPLASVAPASAKEPLQIKPAKLARGADIAVPHVENDHTIVDGEHRIEVKAARVQFLGRWHQRYVAVIGNAQWGNVRLVKVSPAGVTKVLRTHVDPFNAVFDPTSGRVAYSFGVNTQKPTLAVFDLEAKKEVATRSFAALPTLLDFDAGVAVASFFDHAKTITWNVAAGKVQTINAKTANYASVAHDLLGYYSKDPYQGGCQVLTRLTHPSQRLWTSCTERIDAVSPDGKRLATIPLLTDGRGASDAVVRKVTGAVVAEYTIHGWFGTLAWESPTALLLESFGTTRSATVRCVAASCERATDKFPTPDLTPGHAKSRPGQYMTVEKVPTFRNPTRP